MEHGDEESGRTETGRQENGGGRNRKATTATADPESTWNRRQIQWVRAPYDVILSSLPEAESTPISNRHGQQHPLEADVRLRWPSGGVFTTRARREWNGSSIGSGVAWPPRPTQPASVAEALARTLHESRIRPPEHWEAGISELGEWWSLRGCWTMSQRGEPDGNHPAVERWLAVEHNVRWAQFAITAGVRRTDGPQIVATHEGAELTGPLLTGRRTTHTLLQAVWRDTDRLAEALHGWKGQGVTAANLAAWVRRVIGATWGPETGARMLMRNGVPARATPRSEGASTRTVPDDVQTIAWALAAAVLGIRDIEERREMAEGIVDAAAELATWTDPHEYLGTIATREGVPPRVH